MKLIKFNKIHHKYLWVTNLVSIVFLIIHINNIFIFYITKAKSVISPCN